MTNISLLNKEKCSIAVLETVLQTQEMLVDALTEVGYKLLTPVSDLENFIKEIRQQDFDWCILSLEHLSHINLIEFINNIYLISKNPSVLISVINNVHEKEVLLLSLYEQGILSNFPKPDSLDDFAEKIVEFLERVEFNKGNYNFIAGEYVRAHLIKKNFYNSLLQFEKSMLDLHPGSSQCLLNLAEAQCLNKNFKAAKTTLAQAEYVEAESIKSIQEIEKKYNLDQNNNDTNAKNILGINNCLIIDPDTDVQYYVSDVMNKLGISKIKCIENGEDAYKYLKENPQPDLIIMEWKIPKLSGIVLVQRIRKLGFIQCVIIVMSSLVKNSELPLLQEVGVDSVIEKPFDGLHLSKELIGVVQRTRKPMEQRAIERTIRSSLAQNDIIEAENQLKEFMSRPLISNAAKLQMQAEVDYAKNYFAVACNRALNALKEGGESVLLLSLLGKCFLRLKDLKNAARCFEKAQLLSPTNIDRILTLVDINEELGNQGQAKNLLEEAKKIDATRTDVVEAQVRIALKNSDTTTATNLLKTLDSLTGIVGMINNDAVIKIKAGKFDEGIKLYNEALMSLPIDSIETREFITYNLALAYARSQDLEKSLEVLKLNKISLNSKILSKYNSLKNRVRYSIMHNTPLEFQDALNNNQNKDHNEHLSQYGNFFEEINKKQEIKKGSRCCFKIYYYLEHS